MEIWPCWWSACWRSPAKQVWAGLDSCSNKSLCARTEGGGGRFGGFEGKRQESLCSPTRTCSSAFTVVIAPTLNRNSHQRDFNFLFSPLDLIHTLFFSALISTFPTSAIILKFVFFVVVVVVFRTAGPLWARLLCTVTHTIPPPATLRQRWRDSVTRLIEMEWCVNGLWLTASSLHRVTACDCVWRQGGRTSATAAWCGGWINEEHTWRKEAATGFPTEV